MATVTIGANEYDGYTTVAFADEWLAADIARATAWALRNSDTKGRGIISATRVIMGLPWCVDPKPLPTDDDVPEVVQQVTAMYAADLIAKPRLQSNGSANSNIKRAKAGSAEVEFFGPVDGAPPLPSELWDMLLGAGLVCGGQPGDGSEEGPFISGSGDCHRPLGGRWPWDWPIACEDYD